MNTHPIQPNMLFLLAALCFASFTATTLGAPPSEGPLQANEPPGTIILIGKAIQAPDAKQPHLSAGYAWDGKSKSPRQIFSDYRSILVGQRGDIDVLALARNGQQFYLNQNGMVIGAALPHQIEKCFYEHTTYNRDVVLDGQDNVYFSEASGAGVDGKIYRIDSHPGAAAPKATLFCTVHLAEVGRSWGGSFAFGRTAAGGLDTDTLYLASGNQIPSKIFRLARRNDVWSKAEQLLQVAMSIDSLAVTAPNEGYLVSRSENRVYRLNDWKNLEPVLTLPGVALLSLTIVP